MKVHTFVFVLALQVLLFHSTTEAAEKQYCLPTDGCWPLQTTINAFKREMNATGSRVLTKEDPNWPGAGFTFNQAVAKTPGIIVFVENVDQVRRALTFAYNHTIKVSIVSSGHSFPGRCGAEGSMQISVHYMKGIEIDLNCTENAMGCINTQAGVQWGEAYREANKYGRLVVGGSNPTVSVSGWTLGGGHSPLSRSFGMGVDNVLSFHLVTADLSEVWTSAEGTKLIEADGTVHFSKNDTELFYALRGGGSAFGVVLDMTFKLHKDDTIQQMVCSYATGGDNLVNMYTVMYKTLGKLLKTAPNSFSGYIIPSVGCDPKTKQCGGTSVISMLHYGPTDDKVDSQWIANFTALPHQWSAAGLTYGSCSLNQFKSFYEYEMTIPNVTYTNQYMGGSLVQEDLLTDATVEVIVKNLYEAYKRAEKDPLYNLLATAIWVGGAVKDVPVGKVPVHEGWRKAIFTLSAATVYDSRLQKNPSKQIQGVRDFHNDLSLYSNGKYYNEAEDDLTPEQWKEQFWGDEIYMKLMKIKMAWDPNNIFTCRECLGSDWDPTKESPDSVIG